MTISDSHPKGFSWPAFVKIELAQSLELGDFWGSIQAKVNYWKSNFTCTLSSL